MGGIPIGISPPTGAFPLPVFPPFPTLWVGLAPPGCSQGASGCVGFAAPNFGLFLPWLVSVVFAVFAWLFLAVLYFANWGIYLIAAALVGVVGLFVNGIYALVTTWIAISFVVASYTGPFAPIVAVGMVSLLAVVIVLIVLFLFGLGVRVVAHFEGGASGASGSGGSSGAEGSDEASSSAEDAEIIAA